MYIISCISAVVVMVVTIDIYTQVKLFIFLVKMNMDKKVCKVS